MEYHLFKLLLPLDAVLVRINTKLLNHFLEIAMIVEKSGCDTSKIAL